MTSCIWWRWTALLTKAVCTWQLDSRREERAAMLRCKMSSRMVWQRTIVSVRCPNKNSRTAWCCRWPFSSQVIFVVSLAFSCEHSCAQWSIADTLSCHCRLYFGFKTREIRVRQSKITIQSASICIPLKRWRSRRLIGSERSLQSHFLAMVWYTLAMAATFNWCFRARPPVASLKIPGSYIGPLPQIPRFHRGVPWVFAAKNQQRPMDPDNENMDTSGRWRPFSVGEKLFAAYTACDCHLATATSTSRFVLCPPPRICGGPALG